MEYDFLIIGSGFGGSVSALRLSEKGYRVAVIEQGNWITPADMEEADNSLRRLIWMPGLGMTGFFSQPIYRHLGIVGGVGVGGGSIVYAAVLLKPRTEFYTDPSWSNLGVNWEKELRPHYKTASKMLGVKENPSLDTMDAYLEKTADAMGSLDSFGPTPNGIYFGKPEVMKKDPYFKGTGPSRTGCHLCGECLTGCRYGSKNTLDKNYLYLAQQLGAVILPNRKVVNIIPGEQGGYSVEMRNPMKKLRKYPPVGAKNVILAAGVLGTLELLFRCRDTTETLPGISSQMGKVVRTNSEAIVGIMSSDPELDLTHGTTISSHFFPDEHTHITQNRFPKGYSFMRWYFGPLVDNPHPLRRSLISLGAIIAHPVRFLRILFAKNWHKRISVLTVMQHLDNQLSFTYGRSLLAFFRKRLKSKAIKGKEAPTNLSIANRAAGIFAEKTGGQPLNNTLESIGNLSVTAHILGGCHIGSSSDNGVIDASHRVFGFPGLYVVDGSAVSANVGVNPSLTITAMAERAMSLIPSKNSKQTEPDNFNKINVKKRSSKMKKLKIFLIVIGIIFAVNITMTGINILQNGIGGWDGRTVEQIIDIPPDRATVNDIEKLSKSEIMQLFNAARAPEFSSIKGEYRAKTIDVGIMAFAADFFTHHFFGPGRWEGKAFYPFKKESGWGYNIFLIKNDNGKSSFARTRKMNTYIGKSNIDKRNSFHLDYSPHNTGMVHSMHDEIRIINDKLYIGMGYMAAGGGSINPAPFIVYGEPKPWVGPDKKD